MHFCIIIWLFFHHQRSSSSKSNKLICPANGSLMITSTSSTISVFSISMDFFSSILITEDVFYLLQKTKSSLDSFPYTTKRSPCAIHYP